MEEDYLMVVEIQMEVGQMVEEGFYLGNQLEVDQKEVEGYLMEVDQMVVEGYLMEVSQMVVEGYLMVEDFYLVVENQLEAD
jgi:hypothetical protein